MADALNLLTLICASACALAFGVAAAFLLLRWFFACMTPQSARTAVRRVAKPAAEIAS
jgi:hypothetical protein